MRRNITGRVKSRKMTTQERESWIGFMSQAQKELKMRSSWNWAPQHGEDFDRDFHAQAEERR